MRNTACAELPRSCPEGEGTLPPGNWTLGAAMSAARFCFSPRGWDMGDVRPAPTAVPRTAAPQAPHGRIRRPTAAAGAVLAQSDRYLPAVLHGCVPVMSDRMEAMPLQA